ncbi:hypothetical protein EHO58_13520 [Leptospira selangorensis]|uniref:hypothetical protein n=1 Tax=Leptospira selangorensis TaxID=2484982 RepID=UPI0010826E63|nr:hypothetical protein [Leptospira selangorensis]TGK03437.1 hypothetical protein EHO58_13520 [Leptospira selangorensis]
MENIKSIILGPEYDQDLRKKLRDIIISLQGKMGESSWGLAGSQEIFKIDAIFPETILSVEAETYVGLSITGDAGLVDKIADLIKR